MILGVAFTGITWKVGDDKSYRPYFSECYFWLILWSLRANRWKNSIKKIYLTIFVNPFLSHSTRCRSPPSRIRSVSHPTLHLSMGYLQYIRKLRRILTRISIGGASSVTGSGKLAQWPARENPFNIFFESQSVTIWKSISTVFMVSAHSLYL